MSSWCSESSRPLFERRQQQNYPRVECSVTAFPFILTDGFGRGMCRRLERSQFANLMNGDCNVLVGY